MNIHLMRADPGKPDNEPPPTIKYHSYYDSYDTADNVGNGCRPPNPFVELLLNQIFTHQKSLSYNDESHKQPAHRKESVNTKRNI